jgi:plasmid stability protein
VLSDLIAIDISEATVGQILVRNLDDRLIEDFKAKAKLANKSLEQYVRDLLEANRTFTAEERLASVREMQARFDEPVEPLTKDEMREGLL